MSKRTRTSSDLKRGKPQIRPRESILIVCEGVATEPNYIEAYRRSLKLSRLVEVVCVPSITGSAPITVVERAIELREQRRKEAKRAVDKIEFDETWCVVDTEVVDQNTSLNAAYQKAIARKIRLCLSNPCFEYWLILHFEKTTKCFHNPTETLRHLKGHVPEYAKNDREFCCQVLKKIDIATENATASEREAHWGNDLRQHNPSTHVHHLIKRLKELASFR